MNNKEEKREVTMEEINASVDRTFEQYRKNPCSHDKSPILAFIEDKEQDQDEILNTKYQIADCRCCNVFFRDRASLKKRLQVDVDREFWDKYEYGHESIFQTIHRKLKDLFIR